MHFTVRRWFCLAYALFAGFFWCGSSDCAVGQLITWGNTFAGEAPPDVWGVVAMAGGEIHTVVLRVDGTVVAWGGNYSGQTNVPPGLGSAVTVAASSAHSLALKANGTVVAWGDNSYGQANVPAGLTNVVATAAEAGYSLALKADGTVVAWGINLAGQTGILPLLRNVAALTVGSSCNFALLGNGPPATCVPLGNLRWGAPGFRFAFPTRSGRVYRLEYEDTLNGTHWMA